MWMRRRWLRRARRQRFRRFRKAHWFLASALFVFGAARDGAAAFARATGVKVGLLRCLGGFPAAAPLRSAPILEVLRLRSAHVAAGASLRMTVRGEGAIPSRVGSSELLTMGRFA